MDAPDLDYARSGDVNIAYAVVGEGPFDLVLVGGWVVSNLEWAWEGPAAEFFTRLAEFSRLILFDKRGTGLSDRMRGVADLETRMDDVRAVMDAITLISATKATVVGTATFLNGTVNFKGTVPLKSRRPTSIRIVGGTGRYAHASGTVTEPGTDSDPSNALNTYRFTVP